MDSSAAILLMIALGVAIFALFVWSVPLAARSLFASRVSEVRDAVVDSELRGDVPNDPSVHAFVKICDNLLRDPHIASISFMYAFHQTRSELGEPEVPKSPYCKLAPGPRTIMQSAETQLIKAIAVNLTWGSTLWLPLTLLRWALQLAALLGRQFAQVSGKPTRLATELARAREGSELAHADHGLFA